MTHEPDVPDDAPTRPRRRLGWFVAGALAGAVAGYSIAPTLNATDSPRPHHAAAATTDRSGADGNAPDDRSGADGNAPDDRSGADGSAPDDRSGAGGNAPDDRSGERAETGEGSTSVPGSAPTDEAHDDGHGHGPAPDGWAQTCESFAETFTDTALADGWHSAVSAWMTSAQAAEYADVPVENVPTGNVVTVDPVDPEGGLFTVCEVTYDTGLKLEVGITYQHPEWLVASVRPVTQ